MVYLKKVTVPINVDFFIHRQGEWIMLMLGESVLSLLIVDLNSGVEYYSTFFCGIISIILLEYLHFRSQPHDPDEHALRRARGAGLAFTTMLYIYSTALVVLGTSYKMFLYEFVYEDNQTGDGSAASTSSNYTKSTSGIRLLFDRIDARFLAGGLDEASYIDVDERRQRIANFFSGSLAIVWFLLDAM
jgi:Bacterial low temperature requirement A protein (LtrA)